MKRQRMEREGFVLLAVLWLMVGVAMLGVALDLVGRNAVAASANRVALTQSGWVAEGCISRVRATISATLRSSALPAATWDLADSVVAGKSSLVGCKLRIEPVGITLDINAASGPQLKRFLIVAGVPSERADSLVAALLDWRDPDSAARPLGAEAAWYHGHRIVAPSNSGFQSVAELGHVRGFAQLFDEQPTIEAALGVQFAPVVLSRAPLAVLAALPGFGGEAVRAVAVLRAVSRSPRTIANIASWLSPPARDSLLAHAAELSGLTASSVSRWVVTSQAVEGLRNVTATDEVTLARAGTRVAIVRHRSWP